VRARAAISVENELENFMEFYLVQMNSLRGHQSDTLELCNDILELLNEEIEG